MPSHAATVKSPRKSIGAARRLARTSLFSPISIWLKITETVTIGTFTKKIHCHESVSVSQPPSVGPMAGPSVAPTPKSADAIAKSCGGNASSKIVKATGRIAPPPMPCRMRKKISEGRFQEMPHKNDAMTNTIWLIAK